MKVVFLDVDGVLNSREDGYSSSLETNSHFEYLRQIIYLTNSKIILSSSWKNKNFLEKRLKEFGLDIFSQTPFSDIEKFVRENNITNFVILSDGLDTENVIDNLVEVDSNTGLQESDIYKAVGILNKGE